MAVSNEVRRAVLGAFNGARDARRPSVECYRAGVQAWRDHFPDQAPVYAAKQAVALILKATVGLSLER